MPGTRIVGETTIRSLIKYRTRKNVEIRKCDLTFSGWDRKVQEFMRIKEGFILRRVAGKYVVVAIGPASKSLNGMIRLNDTGAFCWEYLLKGTSAEELAKALVSEYGISRGQAVTDIGAFLDTLREADCLDEDEKEETIS